MWYELLLYNPFMWAVSILFIGCFFSWFFWWLKNTFKFKGSWKKLDKSIHFKEKK